MFVGGEGGELRRADIHKQLKKLEDELGVMLYERVGKQIKLTQAASVLLPHLKEILTQYDSAFSALEEWKGLKRGLVRSGTGSTGYLLPAILRQFEQAYSGVEVQVETGNTGVLVEDLQKGLLDLALIVSSDLKERQDFQIEAVWAFQIVLLPNRGEPVSRPRLAEFIDRVFMLF